MNKDYRDAVDVMFDNQRFGQKNGQGFYRYTQDAKGKPRKENDEQVDTLLAAISQPTQKFSDDDIIARTMIPMINEVVRCLEEGIIASPAEGDIALVYGLGFPPFHGEFSVISTPSVAPIMSKWPSAMPILARCITSLRG